MCHLAINHESVSFWINIIAAFATVASVLVAVVALRIAKSSMSLAESSLSQAKQIAERDQKDWRQRKWFDLYYKAHEAYDSLDHFKTVYTDAPWYTEEWERDWNNLMFVMRQVHTMALVLPKNPAIDELIFSTAGFMDPKEAMAEDRLPKLLNALHSVREKAFVDPAVLG